MSRGLPAGRLVGIVLAVAAITFLGVRIGGELITPESGPESAEADLEVITGVVEDNEGNAAGNADDNADDNAEEPEPLPPPTDDQDVAKTNAQAIARAKAHERSKGKAGSGEAIGLRLGVNDRVKVTIEVDGVEWFDGYLCPKEGPRCDKASPLKVPRAPEIAVALSDLSHARLIYNGRRVEPLGNLDAGRRLVFVDDVGQ